MNEPTSNPFPAVFAVIGFFVLLGGVWWIYRPAALIVGGIVLLVLGFLGRGFGGGR
jgi:hypothetical protein